LQLGVGEGRKHLAKSGYIEQKKIDRIRALKEMSTDEGEEDFDRVREVGQRKTNVKKQGHGCRRRVSLGRSAGRESKGGTVLAS